MSSRHKEFPIQRLLKISPIAAAVDIAYGKRGYHGLADEFKRSYGLARDWQYGLQPLPTRVLVRLIQRLEAGGIIEKERAEAIAAANAEAETRKLIFARAVETIRSLQAERKQRTDKRLGSMSPGSGRRKSVKVLTEPSSPE